MIVLAAPLACHKLHFQGGGVVCRVWGVCVGVPWGVSCSHILPVQCCINFVMCKFIVLLQYTDLNGFLLWDILYCTDEENCCEYYFEYFLYSTVDKDTYNGDGKIMYIQIMFQILQWILKSNILTNENTIPLPPVLVY